MAPSFRIATPDEPLLDFARSYIPIASRKKTNAFALYDVQPEVSLSIVAPLYDAIRGMKDHFDANRPDWSDPASAMFRDSIRNLHRWAKTSFFRLWIAWIDEGQDYQFLCAVSIGRDNDMIRRTAGYRGWAVYAQAQRKIDGGTLLSLVDEAIDNYSNQLKTAATIAATTVGLLLGQIMDRPHEYRLAHGIRTSRERLLNHPATVTISLSRPIVHTISDGTQHGGGWKMPEHDVSGHWMCAERGKAVRGCHHEPALQDGDHAICSRCSRIIVWVPEHKRGDPSVARRTTYRVVP